MSHSGPHACLYFSLSPHRRMSSVSLPALSLALSSCPHLCLSGWGWGSWFVHLCFRRSLSVSPTPGSLLPMGGGGGGGGLGPFSASSPLTPSYLTPGSPSPIPSLMSQASRICLRLSLLSSPTSHPLRISRTLYPSPDWLPAPGEPGCPFSWGKGRRRGGPITWPRPCRPPPHQPGFIKQTGPYIARPRGPGSRGRLIWRGGSARLWGRRWGKGGRGAGIRLPPKHSPPTCPLLQPRESPRP